MLPYAERGVSLENTSRRALIGFTAGAERALPAIMEDRK